jgi:hypothetical protein
VEGAEDFLGPVVLGESEQAYQEEAEAAAADMAALELHLEELEELRTRLQRVEERVVLSRECLLAEAAAAAVRKLQLLGMEEARYRLARVSLLEVAPGVDHRVVEPHATVQTGLCLLFRSVVAKAAAAAVAAVGQVLFSILQVQVVQVALAVREPVAAAEVVAMAQLLE